MIDALKQKFSLLLPPQLVDNGDFAGNTYIDTAGWGHALFLLAVGTLDAAIGSTAETTPPLIEECDTTDGSYTAVSSAAMAAVVAATNDDELDAIGVDLTKSHKRYMRVQAPHSGDGTTGSNLAIIGMLSKPEGNAPVSATQMGLNTLVNA